MINRDRLFEMLVEISILVIALAILGYVYAIV